MNFKPNILVAELEALKSGLLAAMDSTVTLKVLTNSNVLISIMKGNFPSPRLDHSVDRIYDQDLIMELHEIMKARYQNVEFEFVYYSTHMNDLQKLMDDSISTFCSQQAPTSISK